MEAMFGKQEKLTVDLRQGVLLGLWRVVYSIRRKCGVGVAFGSCPVDTLAGFSSSKSVDVVAGIQEISEGT